MTRTPIDWTFDGHPIYPPECDLPLPRFCAESTITRAFGFTLDTQTGAVERWAAGDPASVVEHLPSCPAEPQGHWCELCGDSLTTLRHDAAIGWHRNCDQCGSEYQGTAERAMTCKPCRCGPDGRSVGDHGDRSHGNP